MASPDLSQGGVAVAHDLYVAIDRAELSALERRIISAVMYFTYGAGKTKAEIRAEHIRYYLGADKKLRTDRIEEAITGLLTRKILFRQELVNGSQLLGLQKDYDLWGDKMSPSLQEVNNIYINITSSIGGDKMSQAAPRVTVSEPIPPPEQLVAYARSKSNFTYGTGAYRVERKYAKQLYIEALSLTRSPDDALNLLKDYIDQDDWMRANVKMVFTFMSSRFKAWADQIPRKPREIRESEEAMGRRYQYNVKLKRWEAT